MRTGAEDDIEVGHAVVTKPSEQGTDTETSHGKSGSVDEVLDSDIGAINCSAGGTINLNIYNQEKNRLIKLKLFY